MVGTNGLVTENIAAFLEGPASTRRCAPSCVAALAIASIVEACGGGPDAESKRHASGLASSVWPKYRGNLENTGRASGVGACGAQKWRFETGGVLESAPSLAPDGTLYFGSDDARVYALDGFTGLQHWEQTLEPGSTGVTAASIDGAGILYVQTERPLATGGIGKLSALNPVTGGCMPFFSQRQPCSHFLP